MGNQQERFEMNLHNKCKSRSKILNDLTLSYSEFFPVEDKVWTCDESTREELEVVLSPIKGKIQ